jgi:hypothetical protein
MYLVLVYSFYMLAGSEREAVTTAAPVGRQ